MIRDGWFVALRFRVMYRVMYGFRRMRMKRKQVYIYSDQDQRLRALARRHGATESDLLRAGVDRILAEPLPQERDHHARLKSREFIDALVCLGPVKGRRRWNREDAHGR